LFTINALHGDTRRSFMDALRSPNGNKLSLVVPVIRGSIHITKKEGAVGWNRMVLISAAVYDVLASSTPDKTTASYISRAARNVVWSRLCGPR
jgi:hypothetical protein